MENKLDVFWKDLRGESTFLSFERGSSPVVTSLCALNDTYSPSGTVFAPFSRSP